MKFVRLKYFLIISAILVFSIVTPCTDTAQQVTTYKTQGKIKLNCVMSSEDNNKLEAFKTFAADIKTLLPNYDISFNFVKGDLSTYETKIKVLLSSNNIPDVFFSSNGSLSSELLYTDSVQPIDKYLDKLKFWDTVISCAKVDGYKGHIYAVPFDPVYYQVIEINTDLFQQNNIKPPANFNELQTAISVFKSKGIIPIALGGKDGSSVYKIIEAFACTINPQITSRLIDGKENFSDEAFKQSSLKMKELMDIGAFEQNFATVSEQDAANLFCSGKAAMYCTSSSDFKTSNAKLNGKCGLLSYPSINNSVKENINNMLVGGVTKNSGLFVSTASEHPTEAVNLAIEMSKHYNRYLYEKQNNSAIIYIPSKLGLKSAANNNLALDSLMQNLANNKNTSSISLLQGNSIPPAASKAIIDDSSAFMTGLLSVDNYTKRMDNGLKLK